MDTSSIYSLMDLLITGCGVYVIYLYMVMVKTRKLEHNVLMPKDLNLKKCSDVEGYINYIGPKQLVFGVVASICGAIGLIQDFTSRIGLIPYLISIAVFLAATIWYTIAMKKAIKTFWEQ